MIRTIIGTAAAITAAASLIPYLRGIVRGTTQPARATYIAKAALGLTLAGSYLAAGARSTAGTLLVFAASAVVVLALSLQRGVGRGTSIDGVVLSLTALGVVAWWTTGNPQPALYLTVVLKWVAHTPTLVKLRAHPRSESPASWNIALASDALNLSALPSFKLAIALPAINEVLLSAVTVIAISVQATHQPRRQVAAGRFTPSREVTADRKAPGTQIIALPPADLAASDSTQSLPSRRRPRR